MYKSDKIICYLRFQDSSSNEMLKFAASCVYYAAVVHASGSEQALSETNQSDTVLITSQSSLDPMVPNFGTTASTVTVVPLTSAFQKSLNLKAVSAVSSPKPNQPRITVPRISAQYLHDPNEPMPEVVPVVMTGYTAPKTSIVKVSSQTTAAEPVSEVQRLPPTTVIAAPVRVTQSPTMKKSIAPYVRRVQAINRLTSGYRRNQGSPITIGKAVNQSPVQSTSMASMIANLSPVTYAASATPITYAASSEAPKTSTTAFLAPKTITSVHINGGKITAKGPAHFAVYSNPEMVSKLEKFHTEFIELCKTLRETRVSMSSSSSSSEAMPAGMPNCENPEATWDQMLLATEYKVKFTVETTAQEAVDEGSEVPEFTLEVMATTFLENLETAVQTMMSMCLGGES